MVNRIRKILKGSLVAMFFAGACEPGGGASVSASAEPAMLTADAPVTAFEVTLCATGEPPHGLTVSGRFSLRAFTNGGSSVELTVESLALEPDGDELVHTNVDWARNDLGNWHSIALVAEADLDSSGRRCTEAEVVQVSVAELAEGQVVELVEVNASISAQWFGRACDPDFGEDKLSVELVQL